MKRHLFALAVASLIGILPTAAAEFGTKEEAVAMVKRVQAQFKKDGAEATFKAVSDKSIKTYHDRDLYPFIYHCSESRPRPPEAASKPWAETRSLRRVDPAHR